MTVAAHVGMDLDLRRELRVRPALDGQIHEIGGLYVRRYWLPILGPTSWLLLAYVNENVGQEWSLRDIGKCLGVGSDAIRNAVNRTRKHHALNVTDSGAIVANCAMYSVTDAQRERLPEWLR